MKRSAKAHWSGNLKQGKGKLTTQSGVLNNVEYSFKTRFEEGVKGTNPEELLAAAHAACFTMAVCSMLTQKGLNPEALDTEATISLNGSTITGVHLSITAYIENISLGEFTAIVKNAGQNCIISKALNIPVTSEAYCGLLKNLHSTSKDIEM